MKSEDVTPKTFYNVTESTASSRPAGRLAAAAELVSRARDILRLEDDLQLAMLYGSMVSGDMRAHSDVDMGVLFAHPLTVARKMDLTGRLQQALLRDVDLVDLSATPAILLRQILCKGRVLIQRRPDALAELVRRMVYHEADMMPYVRRTLIERQHRFIHG